jgi:hypothetical protein
MHENWTILYKSFLKILILYIYKYKILINLNFRMKLDVDFNTPKMQGYL